MRYADRLVRKSSHGRRTFRHEVVALTDLMTCIV